MYIDAVTKGIDDLPTVDPEIRKNLLNQFEIEGLEGLRTQLKFLDPEYYKVADLMNHKRLLKAIEVSIMTGKPYSTLLTQQKKTRDFDIVKICLTSEREWLYNRINKRVDLMIEQGLLEEVKNLLPYRSLNALNTVGYKELFDYLDQKITLETAIELIKRDSRRYAKRQLTWFSREKDEYRWFNIQQKKEILDFVKAIK